MMTKHRFNPALPIFNPTWEGNLFREGRFVTMGDLPIKQFSDVIKWKISGNPQAKEKAQDTLRPKLVTDAHLFDTQDDCVVWMGHASFFIRIGGINILTDPVYVDLPLMPRQVGIPCALGAVRKLDYLLLSHDHRDHFDTHTLGVILENNPKVEVLMPLAMTPLFRTLSIGHKVQEAGWWQRYQTPETVRISYVPAKHWCRRWLTDTNRILWGGFVIEAGGKSVYFMGDSAYDAHFEEIASYFSELDMALIPVGAYKPAAMMKEAHMSPHEGLQSFWDLGAKRMMPMHYGTFDLSDEPMGEPLRLMQSFAAQHEGVLVPAVGEKILL